MPADTPLPAHTPAKPQPAGRFRLRTWANAVALTRGLLAFAVVAMLYAGRELYVAACAITLVAIWMDALDGWVARRLGEVSKFGAVLDILTDRIVEMTYWIAFAALGWIPVWMPLIVAARGFLVDGARSLAFEQGQTAFGDTTMMTSPLGRFIVASRASRNLYGFAKAAAFALLILAYASQIPPNARTYIRIAGEVSAYLAIILCVVRALPVLAEGAKLAER
ncbi:MAG TPA: CDP-alcohol phosphatidyltransferase family protein [Longimicrobiaceae bacterium]|jgi:CDP-diacylglycerol--glycerol-3-phosphate 3-phosphatidyltransferase|nr:CDP-alcohol phosphatidyltransferase family protein [Longimicrobiaceae bacterium]